MFVELKEIKVTKNRIDYIYTFDKELKPYINIEKSFFIEYLADIDFSSVPKSVLAIPFVVNFLPFSWFFGAKIEVESLDKSFYDSIF